MKILLTGGGSDIGQAIARRRIATGDSLVVSGSSEKSTLECQRKLEMEKGGVQGLVLDFSNPDAVHAAVTQEINDNGPPDAVILNAFGRMKPAVLHERSFAEARTYVDTNVAGNLAVIHACLPAFTSRQSGRFLLISSVSAVSGTSGYGVYCAAKAALEGLFLNLAVDYGGKNIQANIVRPGIIATNRNRRYWSRGYYQTRITNLVLSGRLGTPNDVAESLDYFLSANCYSNGTVLTVSGGLPLLSTQKMLNL